MGLDASALPPLPDNPLEDRAAAHLDPRAWFDDPSRPLEIEIGSGKGTFLIQQAPLEPGMNFLGIERAREFWAYAADRLARHGLSNVRLLRADGAEFLHWRCPDAIARVIHLYFPDPWPKRRHHRRRIVQDSFLADCRRVLLPGGELRIVTDHDEYWAWMREHFARWTGTGPTPGYAGPSPAFRTAEFGRPSSAAGGELVGTNFERKYRREGRPFHAAVLRKPAG